MASEAATTPPDTRRRSHSNGEGGVRYDKARKRWIGTITLGWEAVTNDDGEVIGRQKRRSVTGKTKAEVLERLREAQNLHGDGIHLPPAQLTVGTMLERWITYIVPGTVATLTEQQYRHIVTKMLTPRIGRKHLKTLAPFDVTMMLRDRTPTTAWSSKTSSPKHHAARSISRKRPSPNSAPTANARSPND